MNRLRESAFMGLKKAELPGNHAKKRFIRKRDDPFLIIALIKLWPSRKGILHGVRSVRRDGNIMTVITHCNRKMRVRCSRKGRVARWIRNKWYEKPCKQCRVPGWKLKKYSETSFVTEKRYAFGTGVIRNAEAKTC